MAELSVSRKSISKLFKELADKKFVIPEYQRPYAWSEEKCETLWTDIKEFFEGRPKGSKEEYFLGSIVTYHSKAEDGALEVAVIDGQQRITSLFLLLRAFYAKLESMREDDNILGLKRQIAPCLWKVHEISQKVEDKSLIHIESRVATESDNESLHAILRDGASSPDKKDLYNKNYDYFFEQCDNYARENPTLWQHLCVAILNDCIVLPIECENESSALTIFSTLNNRGEPLSDSDIFKATIYRSLQTKAAQKDFSDRWRDLSNKLAKSEMTLDEIFRFYSHHVRAKEKDSSKEIGLRKFYELKREVLKSPTLMDDLESLGSFWCAVKTNHPVVDGKEILSFDALKYLHCLSYYTNEYWKYLTSVYYLTNGHDPSFKERFPAFLRTLIAFLFSRFLEKPTVNAIKDDIYRFCIAASDGSPFSPKISPTYLEKVPSVADYKIIRGFLLLVAYQNPKQNELISDDFEIEHIFPRVWQTANYNGWSKEDAEEFLESVGNKVVIEKKINIQAGNGYFAQKKEHYRKSRISEVKDLSQLQQNDWIKADIANRGEAMVAAFSRFVQNACN